MSDELIGLPLSEAERILSLSGISYSVIKGQQNPKADTELVVKIGKNHVLYVFGFLLNVQI